MTVFMYVVVSHALISISYVCRATSQPIEVCAIVGSNMPRDILSDSLAVLRIVEVQKYPFLFACKSCFCSNS